MTISALILIIKALTIHLTIQGMNLSGKVKKGGTV